MYSETSKLLSSSPDETTDFETMNPFFYKLSDQVDHIIQVLIVCFLLLKTLNFLLSLMKKKRIFFWINLKVSYINMMIFFGILQSRIEIRVR